MEDTPKYRGPKVVEFRKTGIRSTIRRVFNRGLEDCRNLVVIVEGQEGGIYIDWSSVDVVHSLELLRQAKCTLESTTKGNSEA